MLNRYILGIDPGKRTGLALLDLLMETCIGVEVLFEEYADTLTAWVETYHPDIAIESFIINSATVKNTQAPWSLEGIGIARYVAYINKCHFVVQAQSSAKRFATNDRLKALGWYVPGQGHLADGQRQCLLYAVDHGWWHDSLGTESD